mmetsp:Transcript_5194/g.11088  ORF Transcript_5194/g.11088 Transcript_5194/m.11088 type:complete len:82 (-) Transcript_5194:110-355(-)
MCGFYVLQVCCFLVPQGELCACYCFPESAFATFIGCKGCVFFGAAKVSRMGGITMGNTTPAVPIIRDHMTTGSSCMFLKNH